MNQRADFDYEQVFMGVGNLDRKEKGVSLKAIERDYRFARFSAQVQKKEGKILDLGCGAGWFIEAVKHHFPTLQAFACDVSQTAIQFAREHGSGAVDYRVITNSRLPYEDSFFDICIAMDVLEHLEDLGATLREVHRVLKPGGKLHVCVPCEGNSWTYTWWFAKLRFGTHLTYKHWGHVHPELTTEGLFACLERNRFRISNATYSWHILSQLISVLGYFLPKELLERLLGQDKACLYGDSALARAGVHREGNRWLLLVRRIWMKGLVAGSLLQRYESLVLRNTSFTAGKVHATCEKA